MGKWGCQEKHGKTLLLLQGIRMTMKVSGARYGSAPLFDRPTTQLTRIEWSVDGSATEVKIAVAAKFLWQFFKWVSFSQRPKDGNHKLL
jgi:hypothetical protein